MAAEEGFDDTWVSNFGMFVDEYGVDGSLSGQQVMELVPRPRIYAAAIYWALTTVRACHGWEPCSTSCTLMGSRLHLPGSSAHKLLPTLRHGSLAYPARHLHAEAVHAWAPRRQACSHMGTTPCRC